MVVDFALLQTLLGPLAVFTAAATWFIISTVVSYRKLRHIPGPWLARISQLWLLNVTSKGDLYLWMEEVIQKYGMIRGSLPRAGILSSNRLSGEDWT